MNVDQVIEQLKENGHRITKTRRLVIESMVTHAMPVSVQELLQVWSKKRMSVNKTTLYRELDFLEEQGIVRQVQLGQDRKRYELTMGAHHHHIRCIECGRIEDVDFPDHLRSTVNHIQKNTKFTVIDHSLEFVGVCADCRA